MSNKRRYTPGDVAVIHPLAASDEVDAFLESAGWKEGADDPIHVQQAMSGQTQFCFTSLDF